MPLLWPPSWLIVLKRRALVNNRVAEAVSKYLPQSYNGRVILFRTQSRPLLCTYNPEIEWRKLTENNVELHEIPGFHEGIFKEPHVQVLAGLLRKSIKNASNTSVENGRY